MISEIAIMLTLLQNPNYTAFSNKNSSTYSPLTSEDILEIPVFESKDYMKETILENNMENFHSNEIKSNHWFNQYDSFFGEFTNLTSEERNIYNLSIIEEYKKNGVDTGINIFEV